MSKLIKILLFSSIIVCNIKIFGATFEDEIITPGELRGNTGWLYNPRESTKPQYLNLSSVLKNITIFFLTFGDPNNLQITSLTQRMTKYSIPAQKMFIDAQNELFEEPLFLQKFNTFDRATFDTIMEHLASVRSKIDRSTKGITRTNFGRKRQVIKDYLTFFSGHEQCLIKFMNLRIKKAASSPESSPDVKMMESYNASEIITDWQKKGSLDYSYYRLDFLKDINKSIEQEDEDKVIAMIYGQFSRTNEDWPEINRAHLGGKLGSLVIRPTIVINDEEVLTSPIWSLFQFDKDDKGNTIYQLFPAYTIEHASYDDSIKLLDTAYLSWLRAIQTNPKSNPSEFLNHIGHLYWFQTHAMPYARGSEAILKWLIELTAQYYHWTILYPDNYEFALPFAMSLHDFLVHWMDNVKIKRKCDDKITRIADL